MFHHEIHLQHRREPMAVVFGKDSAHSSVDIDASSTDLKECWREVLSRMPPETYKALVQALEEPHARS